MRMFRRMKQITVKVPEPLLRYLADEAARQERPLAGVVRRMIADAARRTEREAAA